VTGIAQLTGVCASPTCGFVFDVKRQNAAVDGGSGKWKLVKAVLHDHACGRLRTTSIAADANAPAASAKSRKDNARCAYGAGVLARVVVAANSSSKTSFKPESVKLLITPYTRLVPTKDLVNRVSIQATEMMQGTAEYNHKLLPVYIEALKGLGYEAGIVELTAAEMDAIVLARAKHDHAQAQKEVAKADRPAFDASKVVLEKAAPGALYYGGF